MILDLRSRRAFRVRALYVSRMRICAITQECRTLAEARRIAGTKLGERMSRVISYKCTQVSIYQWSETLWSLIERRNRKGTQKFKPT